MATNSANLLQGCLLLLLSAAASMPASYSASQHLCTAWRSTQDLRFWRQADYLTDLVQKYLRDSISNLKEFESAVLQHRLMGKSVEKLRDKFASKMARQFGFKSMKVEELALKNPATLGADVFHNAATAAFLVERLLAEEVALEVLERGSSRQFAEKLSYAKDSLVSAMHHLHHILHRLGHRFSWHDLDRYRDQFHRIELLLHEDREIRYLRDYFIAGVASDEVGEAVRVAKAVKDWLSYVL